MGRALRKYRWVIVALALVAAPAAWFGVGGNGAGVPAWRLAAVERGSIAQTVSSTGTVNPVVTVQVGSQVSGQIAELLADFNTAVKAGQVVARLDPATFEAKVLEARADVQVAKANVSMQQANVGEVEAEIQGIRAMLTNADQDLKRSQALLERGTVAASVHDKAVATRDQLRANLESAGARLRRQKAQLDNAVAVVQAKEATLRQRDLDHEHSVIRSPVDGVVISRNVDIGQTVAASLQAPVLFTIAQDLRHMQVQVRVDEADIGRIREGQPAKFTVDAYPGREFAGTVEQVRKAPTDVQNVVTYTVVVGADNTDLALLPGMTANVEIVVGARDNVLRVANAALRFRPSGAEAPPEGEDAGPPGSPEAARARAEAMVKRMTERLELTPQQQTEVRAMFAEVGQKIAALRREGATTEQVRETMQQARLANNRRIEALLTEDQRRKFQVLQAERGPVGNRRGQVWIADETGRPRPVDIAIGLADGNHTEIVRGDLKEGSQVIVGVPAGPAKPRQNRLGF
jgi:HlyD family secretion protein